MATSENMKLAVELAEEVQLHMNRMRELVDQMNAAQLEIKEILRGKTFQQKQTMDPERLKIENRIDELLREFKAIVAPFDTKCDAAFAGVNCRLTSLPAARCSPMDLDEDIRTWNIFWLSFEPIDADANLVEHVKSILAARARKI